MLRTNELGSLHPFGLPVVEPFGDGFAVICHSDEGIHRRTLRHSQFYLLCHIRIIHADDGLDRGTGITIDDVFLRQHVGGRNHDGTNLTKGQHYYPPLVTALQDEHHGVVLADA